MFLLIFCIQKIFQHFSLFVVLFGPLRVLPRRVNFFLINWLPDASRFFYDFLHLGRLFSPLEVGNSFGKITAWLDSFEKIANLFLRSKFLKLDNFFFKGSSLETQISLSYFLLRYNLFKNIFFDVGLFRQFFFVQQLYDRFLVSGLSFLFVFLNPRLELPLLNATVRVSINEFGNLAFVFGKEVNLNYAYLTLGLLVQDIVQIFSNSTFLFLFWAYFWRKLIGCVFR